MLGIGNGGEAFIHEQFVVLDEQFVSLRIQEVGGQMSAPN